MDTIGFIGLGNMGKPMAENLLDAGFCVWVFDIQKQAVDDLVRVGAKPATNIRELAEHADIVFTMLQTGDQVNGVCLGEEGLFNFLTPHALYIDSSSINITDTRRLHQEAEKLNIAMIDAPVSGGVVGAIEKTLTFMIGGKKKDFLRAEYFLKHLGKKIIFAGEAGSGQAAKICNNMILGISMIGVSEAFILAKQLGLDAKKFFEIANNSSGQCWSLSNYCPMPNVLENVPASKNFVPGFAAAMMLKDLKLSQAAAAHAEVSTPLGAEATALYSLFVNGGNGHLDFSGIIKMIEGKSSC